MHCFQFRICLSKCNLLEAPSCKKTTKQDTDCDADVIINVAMKVLTVEVMRSVLNLRLNRCSLQTTAACWIWLRTRWSDRGRGASLDCAAWCPAEHLHRRHSADPPPHLWCIYTVHIYISPNGSILFVISFSVCLTTAFSSDIQNTCVRSLWNSAPASLSKFFFADVRLANVSSTVHTIRGGKKQWTHRE